MIGCLKGVRVEAGVTQQDLAVRVGRDQTYVSKYEHHERRLDLIEVRALCLAMNVELVDFVRRFEAELTNKGRRHERHS